MNSIVSNFSHRLRKLFAHSVSASISYSFSISLGFFCLTSILILVSVEIPNLALLTDSGYPDSAVLYDVERFRQTSTLYRDLSEPPYVPVMYSPMLYLVLALPNYLFEWSNSFVGPRLVVLISYFLCVVVIASITYRLEKRIVAVIWSVLLASSILTMYPWILQLRTDFLGILFGLLVIRNLLSPNAHSPATSGLLAGIAVLFKLTFVSSFIVGVLWLAAARRWTALGHFVLAGGVVALGGYALFWFMEPDMLRHITSVSLAATLSLDSPLSDPAGTVKFIYECIKEPVAIFAFGGILFLFSSGNPGYKIVLMYAAVSFMIAAATSMQIGAGQNYFLETLFSLVPIAVFTVLRLVSSVNRNSLANVLLACMLVIVYMPSNFGTLYRSLQSPGPIENIRLENEKYRILKSTLTETKIFSTLPEIAVLNTPPIITDPLLAHYLAIDNRFDAAPMLRALEMQDFDVVITKDLDRRYRGVHLVMPDISEQIRASYLLSCTIDDMQFHLPRGRLGDSAFKSKLFAIGCL